MRTHRTVRRTARHLGFFNVEPNDAYSYVFDGQIGTLDYVLLNGPMMGRINRAAVWHINEDEADAIDYNLDFGRPSNFFDGQVPYRCSDHSPVLVGLNMNNGMMGAGGDPHCESMFCLPCILQVD